MVEKINITVCGDGGCGKSTSDMCILATSLVWYSLTPHLSIHEKRKSTFTYNC